MTDKATSKNQKITFLGRGGTPYVRVPDDVDPQVAADMIDRLRRGGNKYKRDYLKEFNDSLAAKQRYVQELEAKLAVEQAYAEGLRNEMYLHEMPPSGDARKDVHELIGWEIAVHYDPRVSDVAAKRQDKLAAAERMAEAVGDGYRTGRWDRILDELAAYRKETNP